MYMKNTKQIVLNLLYKYSIRKYKIDKTCKVWPSKKVKNIKCEGNNIIAKNANVVNVELGYGSGISKDSEIINTKIGKYTALAPGVKIIRGQHPTSHFVSIHPAFYSLKRQYGFTYVDNQKFDEFRYVDETEKYSVIIGNDVWISSQVMIIEGVTIGDGAIIAAGAVVTKDVPAYSIVGGIPAKVIKYRYDEYIIALLKELKWWNMDKDWIIKYANLFDDATKLIEELKSDGEI